MKTYEYPDLKPVQGVELAAVAAGVKYPNRKDLALLRFGADVNVAAVFTTNKFCAAPVQICKSSLSQSSPQALLINTGYANAGTGANGLDDANAICKTLAEKLVIEQTSVLPFSTGVIGERLPVAPVVSNLDALIAAASPAGWSECAEAILTTDTRPKGCTVQFEYEGEVVTVTGIAKGSGMIKPNMATMLGFIATDLAIEQSLLQSLLSDVNEVTFNAITVDGDTSTNDAVVLVATGESPLPEISTDLASSNPLYGQFTLALREVMTYLAKSIIQDGEGATKLVSIQVEQGSSYEDCKSIAYTIAHSPLVKTALFASDPNWGRVLAAIGRAPVHELDVNKVDIVINGVTVVEKGGLASSYTEVLGVEAMAKSEIDIVVSLKLGDQSAQVWTCDLSYDYVKINSDYRS